MNLMKAMAKGAIVESDGSFALYAYSVGRFQFAYIYPTREKAELAARRYKLQIVATREEAVL